MNRDIFEGKWKQFRGLAKEKWGKLTDDDLDTIQGRLDRFAGLLQERYGYARDKAEKEIEAWMNDGASRRRGTYTSYVLLLGLGLLATASCKPLDTASTNEIRSELSARETRSAPPSDPDEPAFVGVKPSADAEITLAVKNRLLADPQVKGLRIALHTSRGVVYLSGILKDEAVGDHVVRLAREIENVRDVRAQFTLVS